MDNLIVALNAVLPLMIYMGIGLLLKRKEHFSDEILSNFNKLVFKVFLPVNMFVSVYTANVKEALQPSLLLYAMGSIFGVYILAFVVVTHLVKENPKRGAMIQIIYRSNFILLGAPIVENIYGGNSIATPLMVGAFVASFYNILAVFTFEYFRSSNFNLKKLLIGVFRNPMIIGGIIGVIFKLMPFTLPVMFIKPLSNVAKCTTPFALIVLGASFSMQCAMEEIREILFSVFGKLVVTPTLILGGGILLGFRGLQLATLMAMSATPAAVAAYPMAQQMGGDADLSGSCVILTSAIACVTLFLWVLVLKTFGLL